MRIETSRPFAGAAAAVLVLASHAFGCAPAEVAPPPAPVAAPAPAPPPPGPPSRLRRLFPAGDLPALFDAAAPLRLSMPIAEARNTVPALFAAEPLRPDGLDDVRLFGESDAYGRLGAVVLSLARAGALDDVMRLWGEPVKGYDEGARSSLYWWFNPAARLRARLEDVEDDAGAARLVLERYLPLAELFAGGASRFGFEREPLLGMGVQQAERVYCDLVPPEIAGPTAGGAPRDDLCASELLLLPPVEYDRAPTRVRVHCASRVVRSYEVMIRYESHVALKDEIVTAMRRKLGSPTRKADIVGRPLLDFAGPALHARLRADAGPRDVIIEVMRTTPPAPTPAGGKR